MKSQHEILEQCGVDVIHHNVDVIDAMTEYAAQYKSDNDRLREALEWIVANGGATMSAKVAASALNPKEKEV